MQSNTTSSNNSGRMSSFKVLFLNFSYETTLHGFKRLWQGNILRWPIWGSFIMISIVMSIFQVTQKYRVLASNPLLININVNYKSELPFPAITVCNTLNIRVSFLVNYTLLLNMTNVLFPQHNPTNNDTSTNNDLMTDIDTLENMEKADAIWTSREFYQQAGLPKEHLILWCRLPDGMTCTSDDFVIIPTNAGFCFKLNKSISVSEGGPSRAIQLLLNIAQYERVPDLPPSGVKIVIHDRSEYPFSDNGLEVAGGYQTSVVMKKSTTKLIQNCVKWNSLKFYPMYTFPACRAESALVIMSNNCGCKPYIVPELREGAPQQSAFSNGSIETYANCSLSTHLTCIVEEMSESSTGTSNVTEEGKVCTGECYSIKYDKELSYSVFKDSLAFIRMIGEKESELKEVYKMGRNSGSFLNLIRHVHQEYQEIEDTANAFTKYVEDEKLLPDYGTIEEKILQSSPCLEKLLNVILKNKDNSEDTEQGKVNSSLELSDQITSAVGNLDAIIDGFAVNDPLLLANATKNKYLDFCEASNSTDCEVTAMFDLMRIRGQMDTIRIQAKSLLQTNLAYLSRIAEQLTNISITGMTQAEKDQHAKTMEILNYYINTVTNCVKHVYDTFNDIYIKNEQPSLNYPPAYIAFLDQLMTASDNVDMNCKKGGPDVTKYVINDTPIRKNLAVALLNQLNAGAQSNAVIMRNLQYKSSLATFLQTINNDREPSSYDQKAVVSSISEMKNLQDILNHYLHQLVTERIWKTDLFIETFDLRKQFLEGIMKYKIVVNDRLSSIGSLVDTFTEKLLDNYPDSDIEASLLRAGNTEMTNADNVSFAVGQVTCLKKLKPILNTIRTKMETDSIDSYIRTFDTMSNSLKAYYEDVKYMTGFYENNVAFVQIYFRDMGVLETVQDRSYDFMSFLCDVGGIVGLWLGSSMLSAFEIFDLLIFEHIRDVYVRIRYGEAEALRRIAQQSGSSTTMSTIDQPIGSDQKLGNERNVQGAPPIYSVTQSDLVNMYKPGTKPNYLHN